MQITGEGIWGPPEDENEAKAVLRRAVELGVNFIDTADSYGPEVSENLIAEALHPYPDDLLIATKGGLERTGPGEWPRNGRPDHLKKACEGSLRRLRVDMIDLYQLHAPDDDVPYEESVGAMKELQDEGKVRMVGVSNVDTQQLATARSIVDVVSVQDRFSIGDQENEDVLDQCESDGLAFIPWFPLGSGDVGEGTIEEVAEAHGASTFQVAIAWLLARSPVMCPIPGTSSVDHLEANVAAADLDLSDEDMEKLASR
jgi:aryl-alcohol dehydrogenase-like predicted oxidoreductase